MITLFYLVIMFSYSSNGNIVTIPQMSKQQCLNNAEIIERKHEMSAYCIEGVKP